jgi:hypothetical protein
MNRHTSSSRPAFQQSVKMRAKTHIAGGHRLAILPVADTVVAAVAGAKAAEVSSDLWTASGAIGK